VQELIIAEGTPYATTVYDVRREALWAHTTGRRGPVPPAALWWHHTCGLVHFTTPAEQLACLLREAGYAEYGLPYNFVVWPDDAATVYYLNDVDLCWPHTYGHNCDVAIAAQGNYSLYDPPAQMVSRMKQLADALATMWGVWLATYGHRDTYPTQCPGDKLYPLLAGY
jgi:hypothetical protein